MVAGEASGDVLAGLLLEGLHVRWPALTAQGIGGPMMTAQGFDAWWPHDKLAVRGYVEVLGHFREIVGIRNQLTERLMRDKPDCFIGVDAPDFNLDVEIRLKAAGVKTIHFVSPSIWAWRGKRIEKIGRAADLVLCISKSTGPAEPVHRLPIAMDHSIERIFVKATTTFRHCSFCFRLGLIFLFLELGYKFCLTPCFCFCLNSSCCSKLSKNFSTLEIASWVLEKDLYIFFPEISMLLSGIFYLLKS